MPHIGREEVKNVGEEKTNCYMNVLHPDSTLSHCMLCAGSSTTSLKSLKSLEHRSQDLIECGLICTLLFFPIKAHKCPRHFISILSLYFIPLPPTLFISFFFVLFPFPPTLTGFLPMSLLPFAII